MFCSKCGNKLNEEAAFCPKCGTPTNNNDVNGSVRNNDTSATNKVNKKWIFIAVATFICIALVMVFMFVRNKSKNGNELTSAQLEEYTVTVPSDYSLTHSERGVLVFNDKDGNGISITLNPNTNNVTGQWIYDNAHDVMDIVYENLGLDPNVNGGITNWYECSTGDFEGVMVKYAMADKDLKILAVMANDSNILYISFYGMDNPNDVFDVVDVIR
nr:zinc-ribbon domain-containing protein [uncultured Butyrivibrio sp.]